MDNAEVKTDAKPDKYGAVGYTANGTAIAEINGKLTGCYVSDASETLAGCNIELKPSEIPAHLLSSKVGKARE